ncbi:hypothetical protein AbraIFM66951_002759 [Aspergillus brasiliensis]|uniref:Rhodopsin domain-containing protein n=1 Tax=Aspergillus brasiliensis TaxID=319629 RepID=A0A9W6DRR2_9EURO|nr:hypothetical protein AbraCBS73388_002767 [Aspergillus brasiliensis]GKZ42826.1 hypothetical protein AbraIFM66951_002759 [Aspergillus brasiliensis]
MSSQVTTKYPPLDKGITPRGVHVLVVTVMMTVLATVFVMVRFFARRRASVEWDDWVCLAALVVGYAFMITTALLVTIGHGGNHMIQFYSDLAKAQPFVQTFIGTDVLAAAGLALAKLSVLLFYRRIFAINRAFSIATWILGAIVVGWFISTACGLIFASHPVVGEWQPWVAHSHIAYKPFWITYGVLNLVLDIVILALPQLLVWKLNLSKARKRQLSLVFLLGAFICVASIIRVIVVAELDMNDESCKAFSPGPLILSHIPPNLMTFCGLPLDSLLLVALWNVIELDCAIICACLPMIPTVLKDVFGRYDKGAGTSGGPQKKGAHWRPSRDGSGSHMCLSGSTAIPDYGISENMSLEDVKPVRTKVTLA